MIPEFFEFHQPTRIVYGTGISSDFSAELEHLKVKRLFLFSDRVLEKIGLVAKLKESLNNMGIELIGEFLDVPPNSEVKVVKRAAELAKRSEPDGLIALGGGSVIDTAKAANILITKGGDLLTDYSGASTIGQPLKPLIVLPTTAGTGSEVTMVAVIYNEDDKVKIPFTDKYLMPSLAILDPELTVTMPPKVTAATGMDAFTHAIEAYLGPQASPISDSYAIKAMEFILKYLISACENGQDLEARGGMLIAANMAGTAFNHSMVGVVHGIAHSLGGLFHIDHGTANTIALPIGLEYNLPVVKEKLAKLGWLFKIDTYGKSDEEVSWNIIEKIVELRLKLKEITGIAIKLSELGLKESDLQAVAEATVMDGTSFYNPREVVAEEVADLLKKAL